MLSPIRAGGSWLSWILHPRCLGTDPTFDYIDSIYFLFDIIYILILIFHVHNDNNSMLRVLLL